MNGLSKTLESVGTSERDRFRTLCDHFEKKEWKKAYKTANDILAVVPDQPDTLSVLGITYYNAPESEGGDKAKGLELIRKGLLKSRLSSYICWYIFGLYNRAEGQYAEAIKSFRSALKGDPNNMLVLDELAALETQVGDYAGLLETRKTLLRLNPKTHVTWAAAAIAAHLTGDHAMAVRLLETAIRDYRTECAAADERRFPTAPATARKQRERTNMWLGQRYTLQELHRYMALVYEEQGKHARAFEYLCDNEKELPDKLALRETKAGLLLRLGRYSEAEALYRDLLRINPDSLPYHTGLMRALKIDPEAADASAASAAVDGGSEKVEKVEALRKHAEWMVTEWPRSLFCKIYRLRVNAANDTVFRDYLKTLLRESFAKGIPSMFQALKSILVPSAASSALLAVADSVAMELAEELKAEAEKEKEKEKDKKGEENGSEKTDTTVAVDDDVPASAWALHFAAQTASALGDHEAAKARIAEAIETVAAAAVPQVKKIDFLTCKARVLRHAGDAAGAADTYEEARQLDTADRYLCNRAAKYLIRAGRIDEAIADVGLFIRKGAGPTEGVLARYQCVWFEYELGRALYAKGDYARALKNFLLVVKDYQEYRRSLNDFHFYVFHKGTVVSYYQAVKARFTAVEHYPRYASAVAYAVRIYLDVHAHKAEKYSAQVELLPPHKAPRKPPAHSKNAPVNPVPEDRDPLGTYYINTVKEPLAEAQRLVESLPPQFPVRDEGGVVEDVLAAHTELACAQKDAAAAEKALAKLKEYNPTSSFIPKVEELVHAINQ